MNFASYVTQSIEKRGTSLCAGFDPVLEALPTVFSSEASAAATDDDYIYRVLFGFYRFALEAIHPYVATIKPNIAFFEQYGLGGLKALQDILILSRDLKLPTILDGKRGDIGSTAVSYANAFLSGASVRGKKLIPFDADSLTVNPFLGFDTTEVFLKACKDAGKGIFVLVKTSNPGSKDLQDIPHDGATISERVARWIDANAASLADGSGLSGLGAVVGATHPKELTSLRKRMPRSILLIPGMGAQGGTSDDVIGGFISKNRGALINVSRGLFGFDKKEGTKEELKTELIERCKKFSDALEQSAKKHL